MLQSSGQKHFFAQIWRKLQKALKKNRESFDCIHRAWERVCLPQKKLNTAPAT